MRHTWWSKRAWVAGGLALSLAGAVVLVRLELNALREAFETDARIVHRLLSQRVLQHDAVLATLALLQPASGTTPDPAPEQRLPALYPQMLSVQRLAPGATWGEAALDEAHARSSASHRPELAHADLAQGRYRVVMAAPPSGHTLLIDAKAMVPWDDWPMDVATSPVAVWLVHADQRLVLQPGSPAASAPGSQGWAYGFQKRLAADSQPFDVVARRHVGWGELPWPAVLAWVALVWAAVLGAVQVQRQRAGRQRAEALLRLDQVARLNTLGELAAGMAHELNQPLTAVLANTQAARRLLAEDPPELDVARTAMHQAAEQARRAADVLGRLRRSIERPDTPRTAQAIDLGTALDRALYLLEPESTRRQVAIARDTPPGVAVWADPVALDQIVHNLLMNALQALERVPPTERTLRLVATLHAGEARLQVIDSGPGIAPDDLARLFEPFFSTREGGLGLGLSLSESLAHGMGGRLTAAAHAPRGAVFTLALPTGPQPV